MRENEFRTLQENKNKNFVSKSSHFTLDLERAFGNSEVNKCR